MGMLLQSGVILNHKEDLFAISAMFFYVMREQIESHCYHSISEVELNQKFDFLLVGDTESIGAVVQFYQYHRRPIPPIIHLIPPHLEADYAYPEVQILRIIQGSLDEMDITLQFDEFIWAVEALTGKIIH